MRVIHIPVKTEEMQRLRIKFVLYSPICALQVSEHAPRQPDDRKETWEQVPEPKKLYSGTGYARGETLRHAGRREVR